MITIVTMSQEDIKEACLHWLETTHQLRAIQPSQCVLQTAGDKTPIGVEGKSQRVEFVVEVDV